MEALIEEVKSHPCLWLTTSPDYKNINMKTTSWEVIAKNLNKTGKVLIIYISNALYNFVNFYYIIFTP